jgi:hypothetical protein
VASCTQDIRHLFIRFFIIIAAAAAAACVADGYWIEILNPAASGSLAQ